MQAALTGGDWGLTRRTDGAVTKTISAKVLWDKMAEASWAVADPGLQFDDTINFWHTCPESGKINRSNPCSEFMSIDDSTCNLGSLNLVRFLDENSAFDFDRFFHACELMTIALDITVSMSQDPSKAMAENSHLLRNLGGGYANLGGLLPRGKANWVHRVLRISITQNLKGLVYLH